MKTVKRGCKTSKFVLQTVREGTLSSKSTALNGEMCCTFSDGNSFQVADGELIKFYRPYRITITVEEILG